MSEDDKKDAGEAGLYYLWHLQMIGLVDSEGEPHPDWIIPPRDQELGGPKLAGGDPAHPGEGGVAGDVLVAIIDNGAARSHPNIPSLKQAQRIDYVSTLRGTTYGGATSTVDWSRAAELLDEIERRASETLPRSKEDPDLHKAFEDIRQVVRDKQPFKPDSLAPDVMEPGTRFGAHGTATAGLVAADPRDAADPDKNSARLRYAGVCPGARLLLIDTIYDYEYWPIIMGLLRAWTAGAHVILIPRAIEDMVDPEGAAWEPILPGASGQASRDGVDWPDPANWLDTEEDPRFTRLTVSSRRWRQKQLLDELLRTISRNIPIVVPAGNSGPGRLDYPATLEASDLIVVGARTAYGDIASYSSRLGDAGDTGVTIYAPSDDREEASEATYRRKMVDETAVTLPPLKVAECSDNDYCPYGVLACDIPGPWGYSVEPGEVPDAVSKSGDVQFAPRSLYTIFGGTSAASAIVAGTVAQMQAAYIKERNDERLSGEAVRNLLRQTAKIAPDMRSGANKMDKDGNEVSKDFLDAPAAIRAARARA